MRIKASTIIIHGVGWLIFISLPLLFASGFQDGGNILLTLFTPAPLLFYTCYVFLFYLNTAVLIPRLYLTKKYTLYFSIILLLLVGVIYLRPFDRLMMASFHFHPAHTASDLGHGDSAFPHYRSPDQPPNDRPTADQPPPDYPPPNQLSPNHVSPDNVSPGHPDPAPDHQTPDHRHPEYRFPNHPSPGKRPGGHFDAVSIFLFVMILALSITVKISAQLQKTEQRVVQAEADKANAELSFLKAQINPHFLFNSLNNIYSLAVTRSEHTADGIMKLSNIMRYVTDDVKEDYVNLQSEIDFMRDYIDLQRLRLGANDQIEFLVSGEGSHQKIAPLILMPFIENIFKYGVSKHDVSPIVIRLFYSPESIEFFCSNKIFPVNKNIERTGIGISNTRQRLQYLYPGKHFLTFETEGDYYTVNLVLRTGS